MSAHAMSKRLERAAEQFLDRTPEQNIQLFMLAAECIDSLFATKNAIGDELKKHAPKAWEWDYGHLTHGPLEFPIWIAWDNGNVDYADEGATVDFAGCIGWQKATPPEAPPAALRPFTEEGNRP